MQQHTLTIPSSWVLKYADLAPKDLPVLDLACGKGRHTRLFLERGYDVTAVDIDTAGLEDIVDHQSLTIHKADIEGAPWPFDDGVFGAVVVTNYLHRPLFPKIATAIATGGILIYETFMKGNEKFGKPDNPNFLLKSGELKQAFEKDFDIIAFEEVEEQVPRPAMRQRICGLKR